MRKLVKLLDMDYLTQINIQTQRQNCVSELLPDCKRTTTNEKTKLQKLQY